ncbi:MAG: hypothetical protein ABJE95_17460 [Byssovorax sp.]
MGASLDELDSQGAYLGNRQLSGLGGGIYVSSSVAGVRNHVFGAFISLIMGDHRNQLEGDAVSLSWQVSTWDTYGNLGTAKVDAAGNLFASFLGAPFGPIYTSWTFPWGVEPGNLIVKWNSVGAHVFTKVVPWSTHFITPGKSGDVFLGGALAAGFDLGCGPIAGAGPHYVARLDAAGSCLWSHAITGSSNPAGSLEGVGSAADGSVTVLDWSFTGTLDIGCGPMTAAPGGSSFAARLDASGACVWSKSFPVQRLYASLFPSGDLLLSASFTGTLDFGGAPLTSVGDRDLAVARLDPSGAHVWSERFGTVGVALCPFPSSPCRAAATETGAVVLSGPLTGWVDFGNGPVGSMAAQTYAVKLDGAGAPLWSHLLPDSTFVSPDPCGAVLAAFDAGTVVTVDKLAP